MNDGAVIQCRNCGAKNRIRSEKAGAAAKCGKCGAPLEMMNRHDDRPDAYTLRCAQCGARNRIPAAKVNDAPKCGKCRAELKIAELFVPQPMMVSDGDFAVSVLQSPLPVLVFFYANWCPSCKTVAPVVEQVAAETRGRIRVAKLNVDGNPRSAGQYNVMSVPQLAVFDNGQLRETIVGGLPKHDLMIKMAHYL